MKHIAAYALCVLGGKAEPSVEDVKKVLSEAGAKVDDEQLNKLIEELKGKSLHEVSRSLLYRSWPPERARSLPPAPPPPHLELPMQP